MASYAFPGIIKVPSNGDITPQAELALRSVSTQANLGGETQ